MKRFIAIAFVLAAMFATNASASGSMDGYIEMLKSDLKTQKVAVVTEGMELSEEQAEIFWPIYREFDAELSKLMDRRIALIKDYAENWDALTDEKADELMKASLKLTKDRDKVTEKYYKKMAKELSPKTAARFMQIDNAISLLLRLQIAAELPLVE